MIQFEAIGWRILAVASCLAAAGTGLALATIFNFLDMPNI